METFNSFIVLTLTVIISASVLITVANGMARIGIKKPNKVKKKHWYSTNYEDTYYYDDIDNHNHSHYDCHHDSECDFDGGD